MPPTVHDNFPDVTDYRVGRYRGPADWLAVAGVSRCERGRESPGLGTAAHLERDVQHPLEDGRSRKGVVIAGRARRADLGHDGDADGRQLFAVALDQEHGRVLHDLKVFEVRGRNTPILSNYASPTPVIERGRVYVTFGAPGTAALETASGKVLWERRDLECNHYRGAGSSPVIFRDLLLLHYDGSDVQYVVALDKRTGRTVWKTERSIDFNDLGPDGKPQAEGDLRKAFSTPQVIEVDGAPLLISMGAKATYAYDPLTGQGAMARRGAREPLGQYASRSRVRPGVSPDRVSDRRAARGAP